MPSQQCQIAPSRVSSRGYNIGPVCASACSYVSTLTAKPFDIFDGGMYLTNIFDEIEGQGHSLKVKVTRLKNMIFIVSDAWTHVELHHHDIWHHVTSEHDIIMQDTDK